MTFSCPTESAPAAGVVVRTHSNVCEVRLGAQTYACRLRGRFRLERQDVLAGDRVALRVTGPGEAMIEQVLPRRNQLVRPLVANVDAVVIVFTTDAPPLDLNLVDRLLILVQAAGLRAMLCLNKLDLADSAAVEAVRRAYAPAGLIPVETSAKQGTNLDCLRHRLGGGVSVLAGQSGVGKSMLLNALSPGLGLEEGELSARVQRGRHTTRGVRLIPVGDGLVADTPGFVKLDLPAIAPRELASYYPEMDAYRQACRFQDCRHGPEPGCAVREAVAAGKIDEGRYRRYLAFVRELDARPRY